MSFLDVVTILIILFVVAVNVWFVLWLAGLPGKIARQRGHAQADAVKAAGWLSLLTLLATWPLVLVWAYLRPIAVRLDESDATAGSAKGSRT